MSSIDPPIGALVEISNGRGIVRFCGTTSFAPGKWVGIELYEPKGKNDGSINGIAYFSCRPLCGVFIRPSQVKVISAEPEQLSVSRPHPGVARSGSGHQRTPSTGVSRAASLRSAGASSSSRSSSPVKPPASLMPLLPSGTASPRISRLAPPSSPVKRISSLALQPRKSFPRTSSGDSSGPLSPALQTPRSNRLPVQDTTIVTSQRATSPLSLPPQTGSPTRSEPAEPQLPPEPVAVSSLPSLTSGSVSSPIVPSLSGGPLQAPTIPVSREPSSQSVARSVDDTELQELRAKTRVLEARRADDARHIRELETRLSEAESFVAIRPKLQAKLNQLQTELIATRRELSDAQQLAQLSDNRGIDAHEQLEMAMLDKEVAEEKAELAQAELEETKERLARMEVELQVLKEGGAAGDDGDPNVKTSLAYIQLEKHNERLKEALIRLRDMSQETEQEQRHHIAELERDIAGIDELQEQHESTLIKLSNAETQIEDLKSQLDVALGAEDMVLHLTERTIQYTEKIEEMRITIEDLEALKELNDELEENHVEAEKVLQAEIDSKDGQIREQLQKISTLEDACQDLDNTIGQFRELVLQLQSELDTLRTQTQNAQHESAAAASQTAAMMSLNLKLQSSAAKNQAKTVELEIRKLETRETRELLTIIQPYLPQVYMENDSDATSCYLFFQRLGWKIDIINNIVGQAHGLPESLNGSVSETLVGICEMRGRAAYLSTLCKRFAAVLRRCDPTSFLNAGRIYPEVAPMEKRIDMHVDLLRRDEFREMEFVSDVLKLQGQFDHLAETYFNGYDYDLGERELGYALSFDYDLDAVAASIGLTKTSVASILHDEDVLLDMGGYDPETELFEPLQKLLDQCKSAKVLSKKLTKRLEDVIQDSAALKAHLVPHLKSLSNAVPELVNFGISLAQQVIPHLGDARSAKSSFQLTTVLSYAKQTAMSTVAKDMRPGTSWWEANVWKITGTPPWVARIEEIRASTAVNAEAERKAAQLQEEVQGLVRTLKARDQNLQEASVKIELMDRRMEAVKKQADTIIELEIELSKARKQERAYEEAMEQLQADLDTLEQDNSKLKAMAAPEKQTTGNQPAEPDNAPIEGSFETSHLLDQIEALRGTVRFLRTENSYLKGQDLLKEIQALPPLPDPVTRIATPPLDPPGTSDTDESDYDIPSTPPTLRSLATETKVLYRDVIKFSSSPRVVDLSVLRAKRAEGEGKAGRGWLRKKDMPAHQILERKLEAERLRKRVKGLLDRASVL
ncbi:dynein associated protein-domain-containing protein [Pisolithus orientalis]|uniref:dynein associated protein-domain-containing protein n=1 Tax=Pisolithus orientalis TaxID=936130 RepID=UPI002224EE66|nr:dynein associated protein-domain-containing protein [Pisolithus orientalis]KAI6012667.1 dynein associated protein-domain-containing protein [Pisolithus orientalis]